MVPLNNDEIDLLTIKIKALQDVLQLIDDSELRRMNVLLHRLRLQKTIGTEQQINSALRLLKFVKLAKKNIEPTKTK